MIAMNERILFDLYLRPLSSEKTNTLLSDDVHFLNDLSCKQELVNQLSNHTVMNHKQSIRSIPVLACAKSLSRIEKGYIQLLLTMHDHSVTPDEHASCNTRFFSFSNKERRIQDIALIKANDRLLNDKAISTSLWKRLYSAKPYWKQYHSFNYRFTAEDFLSMQYGTCLDTAIIASSLFHQNNIPNYVLNIRGVQGGHSILIVHNDNICVSNFSFRNHTYLQDCLAKFDIDSIIVSGQEYWCEDLVGDCALVNALSDLARHGNYRFYCRRIKASLTISTIMKYLESFKS